MTTSAIIVNRAIQHSASQTQVAELVAEAGTKQWKTLADELMAQCDDYSEQVTEHGQSLMFYGAGSHSNPWSVRLIAA